MSQKLIFETYLTKASVELYDKKLSDLYRLIIETAARLGGISLAEQERGSSLILLSMLCLDISIQRSHVRITQVKPSLWEAIFQPDARRINRYNARRFYNTAVKHLNTVRSQAEMEHVLYCQAL